MTLNFIFTHDKPAKKAVLLFHGLTGSPFELKKYGQFLYAHGYDVYAECLPGHGDDVNNLIRVTYNDWLNFAESRFMQIRKNYEKVFVSGLCLGAVLALALGEEYPDEVAGIISLSTTLFLDGWRMPWCIFLMPVALSTIVRFYYTYPECEPYGIKNRKVRNIIKNLLSKSDVGMDNFPMTCVYELIKLSAEVRKKLDCITAPILIIHSKEDDLTSTKSAKLVYNKISSDNKELVILNNSYHMVLYDNEKEFVYEKSIKFLDLNCEFQEAVVC